MTASDNEWQRVVQRMTTSGTKNDNELYKEWQRVKRSDNEWYSKWQRMTTSDNEWQRVTKNDNEWQRITASGKTNEYDWE